MTILFLTLLAALNADAKCKKSYVCDDYNQNCRYVDICDNSMDMPSMEMDPPPSMNMPGLKPFKSMQFPPMGTTECRQMVVNGRWEEVCR